MEQQIQDLCANITDIQDGLEIYALMLLCLGVFALGFFFGGRVNG